MDINRKPSTQFNVASIEWIGEQDGPPERELKRRLIELLNRTPAILRAYLAQVRYRDESEANIVLCLATDCKQATLRSLSSQLVPEIGAIFAGLFGSHEHLDTLFANEQQHRDVARVCEPFFARPQRRWWSLLRP
jgi:hypothetical protein